MWKNAWWQKRRDAVGAPSRLVLAHAASERLRMPADGQQGTVLNLVKVTTRNFS